MTTRRNWIKVYVDQCLRGTMISELTAAERWAWIGFLLMAGDSNIDGKIFLRKDKDGNLIGFSDPTLAELLGLTIEELKSAKEKMVEFQKISINKNGVILILNWKKYQSEYNRQKEYRGDDKSYKRDCNLGNNQNNNLDLDKDKEREKDKEKKEETKKTAATPKIIFNFGTAEFENITEKDNTIWGKAYPACDIKAEINKMAAWLAANPTRKKANYKRFITNWLSRQQDRGGSKTSGTEKWTPKEPQPWED